jgi:hypothetical protein
MVALLLPRGLWLGMMGKSPFFLSIFPCRFLSFIGGRVVEGGYCHMFVVFFWGVGLRAAAGGSHSMARLW